jgi:hypothetical protein
VIANADQCNKYAVIFRCSACSRDKMTILSYARTKGKVDELSKITFWKMSQNDSVDKSYLIKVIEERNDCVSGHSWSWFLVRGRRGEFATVFQKDRQILSEDWKISNDAKTQMDDRFHFVNIKKSILVIRALNSCHFRDFSDLDIFPALVMISSYLSHDTSSQHVLSESFNLNNGVSQL